MTLSKNRPQKFPEFEVGDLVECKCDNECGVGIITTLYKNSAVICWTKPPQYHTMYSYRYRRVATADGKPGVEKIKIVHSLSWLEVLSRKSLESKSLESKSLESNAPKT